ncbi:MAG: hypothetical protein ACXWUG_07255 [Polyangiales bacterium]
MKCFARAERTSEGQETDLYRCEQGHEFGIDWSPEGPPTSPRWPPSDEARKQFETMQRILERRDRFVEAATQTGPLPMQESRPQVCLSPARYHPPEEGRGRSRWIAIVAALIAIVAVIAWWLSR